MAELKTKLNNASVSAFVKKVKDPKRRADCESLIKLMSKVTKSEPRMWGSSIVGFGTYHYVYASGREGDWMMAGFSPRKNALTLYIMPGLDAYTDLLKKLGKHKRAKACLYLSSLDTIDMKVLESLLRQAFRDLKKLYPSA